MNDQDFYAPEFEEKTFERNGTSKTFRMRELSGDEAEKLFDIKGRDGKIDPAKLKGIDSRIIATSVVEFDPGTGTETPISVEQAGKLPAKFRRELVKIAMDVNGLSEAAVEAKVQD
jgi:hypothetical protein